MSVYPNEALISQKVTKHAMPLPVSPSPSLPVAQGITQRKSIDALAKHDIVH